MNKIDSLRKVTKSFDNGFEDWLRRTKKANGLPLEIDTVHHKKTRKILMNLLGDKLRTLPPIKIKRLPKSDKYRYEGIL